MENPHLQRFLSSGFRNQEVEHAPFEPALNKSQTPLHSHEAVHNQKSCLGLSYPSPLTRRNLRRLRHEFGVAEDRSAMSSKKTPSSKRTSSAKASMSITQQVLVLKARDIKLDDRAPKPLGIQQLIERITTARTEKDITPRSRGLAAKTRESQLLTEADASRELYDMLTYNGRRFFSEHEGEEFICVSRDLQFGNCVPAQAGGDEELLQKTMSNVGEPTEPKPDVVFGYADYAFEPGPLLSLETSPPECHTVPRAPWLPYLVCEYKTAQRIEEARVQALRGASAACSTLHCALRGWTNEEPPPEATAVFSLCVDPQVFELRVHWRHVQDDGKVRWVGAFVGGWELGQGLLARDDDVFRVRGAILKMLHWAQTDRLKMMQRALSDKQLISALGEPSTTLPESIVTPSSKSKKISTPESKAKFESKSKKTPKSKIKRLFSSPEKTEKSMSVRRKLQAQFVSSDQGQGGSKSLAAEQEGAYEGVEAGEEQQKQIGEGSCEK